MRSKNTFKISASDSDFRVDKFLLKKGLNFALIQKLIRKGLIRVNGQKIAISYRLKSDDNLEILVSNLAFEETEKVTKLVSSKIVEQIKKSIIFQDQNLIAINKPCGLSVQGGSGINTSLDDILPYLRFDNKENPKLVHRIDKDTSGLLLIARNRQAADFLTAAFKNKTIKKTYLALVKGVPSKKEGVIDIPLLKKYQGQNEKIYRDDLNGKKAVTNYRILETYPDQDLSLLELNPITGRTHQIRVHLKEIGHPIIGDFKYGSKNTNFEQLRLQSRLYLHAFRVEMEDFFGKKIDILTNEKIKNYLEVFGQLTNF